MGHSSNRVQGALIAARSQMQRSQEIIEEFAPSDTAGNLRAAMMQAGAKHSDAEEAFYSLQVSLKRIREGLDDLIKEMGVSEHIIAAGVHKTPRARSSGPQRHLVL